MDTMTYADSHDRCMHRRTEPASRRADEAEGRCKQHASRTINLALQGGGAHGAFTWGVLDRLLEDERIAFEGDQRHQRRRDERRACSPTA